MISFETFIYGVFLRNLDVGLTGIYTLICGLILCILMEKFLPKYNDHYEKNHNTMSVILEVCFSTLLIICSSTYICRIVSSIPFIFDNVAKYKPYQVTKNLGGNVMLAFSLIAFNPSYKKKIELILKRFLKYNT